MGQITDKAECSLARADGLGAESSRIFVQLDRKRILADAAELDANQKTMGHLPLYGVSVSLKDLFDEAGQSTTAGSYVLKDNPAAKKDGVVVERLKAAGALLFGRTSMSEFAYSGIGMNPHHGTPGCIFDKSLIPGGSSSGAALSVAHGVCDIGMGTDTGGSVRLPAAVNGLYGFKPSAQTVSTVGVHALSNTYDSVGPLTSTLDASIQCMHVIRDEPLTIEKLNRPLKLAVPMDAFAADLDATIDHAFQEQLEKLTAAGHTIKEVTLGDLNGWTAALLMTVSYEAQSIYKDYLNVLKTQGDQNVLARLHLSDGMNSDDLATYQKQRQAAIAYFNDVVQPFDALLAPTIKCERPTIRAASNDFTTNNAAVLRNTTYINLVNGCGLTIPVAREGNLPTALMVCGANGQDGTVISAGIAIDACLNAKA